MKEKYTSEIERLRKLLQSKLSQDREERKGLNLIHGEMAKLEKILQNITQSVV